MSASSSEDEVPKELLESVDTSLMNNSLFSNNSTDNNKGAALNAAKLPSLRYVFNENDQFTRTGIAKSKQTFIAKRLSEMLDNQFEEVITTKKNLKSNSSRSTGGVVLFSNSVDYLNVSDEDYVSSNISKRPKINKHSKIDESEVINRCKTVAVSPEWILSGASTKGWSKNTKGKIISVKKISSSSNSSDVIECEIIK